MRFLAEHLQRRDDGEKLLALAFIDFNGFKAVNDTMGHGAGDEVLRIMRAVFATASAPMISSRASAAMNSSVLLEVDPSHLNDVELTLKDAVDRIFKPIAVESGCRSGRGDGGHLLQPEDDAASFVKQRRQLHVSGKADRRSARHDLAQPSRRN